MNFWAAFLGSVLAYGGVALVNWGVHIWVRRRRLKTIRAAINEVFGPLPEPNRAYAVPPPSNPNAN